jgi:hypothetical protein
LEAKKEFNVGNDSPQLLAQMSVVFEKNEKNMKTIYGALTNAEIWMFFKITSDSKVRRSCAYLLERDLESIIRILVTFIANGKD